MSLSAISPKYRLIAIVGLIFTAAFLLLPSNSRHAIQSAAAKTGRWPADYIPDSKRDKRITNSTLGFQQIFALGLPDRTDKRDAMEIGAALTGFHLTWVDGVRGDVMNPKAVPPVHDDPTPGTRMKKDAELGCWRGHMNILQRIIKEGIASALIIEDDADWDIRLPQQLQQFSLATKDILGQRPSPPPSEARPRIDSPYGEDWDILWVGHCGGWPGGQDAPISVIHSDPTMPPAFDMQDFTRDVKEGNTKCAAHEGRVKGDACATPKLLPDDRIVQEGVSPVCTVGYAVSQHGARKMMARIGGLSLIDVDAQIDTEMTEMCRKGKHPAGAGGPDTIRCIAPSPAYIKPHKARGLLTGDSDIQKSKSPEDTIREVGKTQGVVWSVHLNAGNLIDGAEPESQYVKDDKDPLAIKQHGWRYRRPDEYRMYVKPEVKPAPKTADKPAEKPENKPVEPKVAA